MSADMKNIIYSNNTMSRRNELIRILLSGLTDSELENLVRVREEARPIPAPRRQGEAPPIPTPRKNVQQLIQHFEANPIRPYKPIPAPRTKKQQPVPAPRTRINIKRRALKGFTQSFEISLKSDRDALIQSQNTRLAISRLFGTILDNTKGFKFAETSKVAFVKRKNDNNMYRPAYVNGRAQIVINPNDFLPSLQLSQQQILNGIGVWLSEGSIDEHYINTVVYEPTKGSSYIPLPIELQHSRKGLVNLNNEDNECFRLRHVPYLNPKRIIHIESESRIESYQNN